MVEKKPPVKSAEKAGLKVLVVEDEEAIARMLVYNLQASGFQVMTASDGEEALEKAVEYKPDAILLDWMMPLMSGIEVCKELREFDETRTTPIIMLTARGEEQDVVKGLNSGADDYIVKPFSPKELIARLQAVIRRAVPERAGKVYQAKGLRVDMAGHKASFDGQEIKLGPTEFLLLSYLMERVGVVLSREQLLERIWGYDSDVELRTVDTHILRLRKAMDTAHKGLGTLVQTIRSAGYKIDKE